METLLATCVGGVISALVAWGTFRGEGKRQRAARRWERLEELAVEAHREAGQCGMELSLGRPDEERMRRLLFLGTLLIARARGLAPHLAVVAEEFMDGMFGEEFAAMAHREQPAASGTRGRDLQHKIVAPDWAPAATRAWALSGATLEWIREPQLFEKRRRSAEGYISMVVDEGLHDLMAVGKVNGPSA